MKEPTEPCQWKLIRRPAPNRFGLEARLEQVENGGFLILIRSRQSRYPIAIPWRIGQSWVKAEQFVQNLLWFANAILKDREEADLAAGLPQILRRLGGGNN